MSWKCVGMVDSRLGPRRGMDRGGRWRMESSQYKEVLIISCGRDCYTCTDASWCFRRWEEKDIGRQKWEWRVDYAEWQWWRNVTVDSLLIWKLGLWRPFTWTNVGAARKKRVVFILSHQGTGSYGILVIGFTFFSSAAIRWIFFLLDFLAVLPHTCTVCFPYPEINFCFVCFFISSNLPYSALSFLAFGSFHFDEELCYRLPKIFKH